METLDSARYETVCCTPTRRFGYPLGSRGSSFLSQPAVWWELSSGQPKTLSYFYHSMFNLRAAPWRPVASSLPQAAEFNPGTAVPRGDGKHLASCLTTRPGCPASLLLNLSTFSVISRCNNLKKKTKQTKPHPQEHFRTLYYQFLFNLKNYK